MKAGLDADIVALSLAPDMDELVAAGKVDAKWKKQSYKGMVTNSVVVFVVRDGNPKQIKSWNDLLRPGVEIVTPNPFTSGGARWNIMAAYGSWRKQGKTDKQAQANLLKLWKNVVVQDTSARAALSTFNSGKGDVMLAYENEAYFSRMQGLNLQWVIPKTTILIENPIAVTKDEPGQGGRERLPALPAHARARSRCSPTTATGRVVKSVENANRKKFPVRPGLFTIDQLGLGGWDKVQKRFFDPSNSIMARFQRRSGVAPAESRRQPSPALRGYRGTGPQRPCPSALSRPSSWCWSACRSPRSCGRRRARGRSRSGTRSRARRRSQR